MTKGAFVPTLNRGIRHPIRPVMRSSSGRPFWMPPLGRLNAAWWFPVVAVMMLLDYLTAGTALPVVYAVPVTLAAWYSGQASGLWLALILPASRLAFELWFWPMQVAMDEALLTAMIRISTFTILALLTFRLSEHERALERDLAVLQGLLPLCSFCKSIKNTKSEWESLESYLESRSGAEFSHGICPDCSSRIEQIDATGRPVRTRREGSVVH